MQAWRNGTSDTDTALRNRAMNATDGFHPNGLSSTHFVSSSRKSGPANSMKTNANE